MELTKQVVSLELAKKLKSLGVKQESLFVWLFRNYKLSNPPQENWDVELRQRYYKVGEQYSAFTVAELGEMLDVGGYDKGFSVAFTQFELSGDNVFIEGKGLMQSYKSGRSTREKPEYICYFNNWGRKIKKENGSDFDYDVEFSAETEADARAKMLVFLIENKLVTLNND